jgi:hypothetical protein
MLSRLSLKDGLSVLEPAAGEGAFVAALLDTQLRLNICCIDKSLPAIDHLRSNFGESLKAFCADSILDSLTGHTSLLAKNECPEFFDRIVGNPPYGGWLDYDTRTKLKDAFPGFHVRETYALFILRSLGLLAKGGILSFIVPDTFLSVGAHKKLRETLLRDTEILELVTMPSKLFPGVAFGYSGLCILTIRSPIERLAESHSFRVIAINSAEELVLLGRGEDSGKSVTVLQRDVVNRPDSRIWTTSEQDVERVLSSANFHLRDIADCKTGIYTGDNQRFIRARLGATIRAGNYVFAEEKDLCSRQLSDSEKADGIANQPTWIPIVKGGSHRFLQKPSWVIDWSNEAVSYYRNDSKARLQNSDFYFRAGIGVPMVTSSRINAFLIEERVFDQSVVGIFPKDPAWVLPLLLVLNSTFATKLLKEGINPTANNSANYLKKLPIPNLSATDLEELSLMAHTILEKKTLGISTAIEEQCAEEKVALLYERESSLTKKDISSAKNYVNDDMPLFPYHQETKCSS